MLARAKLSRLSRKLTAAYVVALSIIAALSCAAYVILDRVIDDQSAVAEMVNIAGRQRMLSQRLAWQASRYAATADNEARANLRDVVSEMSANAARLRSGVLPGFSVEIPERVAKIYEAQDLDRRLETYLAHGKAIAATDAAPGNEPQAAALTVHLDAIMREASGPILDALNAVVAGHVSESNERVATLRSLQRLTLAAILLTLAGVGLFIFRPLVFKIVEYIQRMISRARRVIAAQQAAQDANKSKSMFLANMSHEIRTPLNGILGNLELLAQTEVTPGQIEMIESADKASKSLLALIGNILDFSKIEAGKLTIETDDFSPAAVLEDAIEVLQSIARQKGIFISAYYDDEVPLMARGDPVRLRQILLNLIGNAVKFTERGGIQACVLTRPSGQPGVCTLRYEIHDSGTGFDPANAAKLFDAFTQDKINKDVIKGTGLGLSICRKLVESFGGAIGCDGAVGKGGSFWFELPAPIVTPAQACPSADLTGKRILMISSHAIPADLHDYFTARQASITLTSGSAASLKAAREAAAQKHPFDLAILFEPFDAEDWGQLCEDLRECRTVPAYYANDDNIRRRQALRRGFAFLIGSHTVGRHMDRNVKHMLGQLSIDATPHEIEKVDYAAAYPALRSRKILVLEDSLTNQTVIGRQLRTFGVEFVIAGDGSKGLEALDQGNFDLILCDCSMPVMNGFEFTRAVRAREAQAQNQHRQIIVALTANAFREDEEKCLAAGMDDFVSKPVTLGRLGSVLNKWLAGLASAAAAAEPPASGKPLNGHAAIDLQELAGIIGTEDREIHRELLGAFADNVCAALKKLESAVAANDAAATVAAAHSAKGDARSMGAKKLGDIYAELEAFAKKRDAAQVGVFAHKAAQEVGNVSAFISHYMTGAQA